MMNSRTSRPKGWPYIWVGVAIILVSVIGFLPWFYFVAIITGATILLSNGKGPTFFILAYLVPAAGVALGIGFWIYGIYYGDRGSDPDRR